MKRIIIAIATGTLLLSSCVTLGKYEALENKNNRLKKEVSISKQEMKDMQAENAELRSMIDEINKKLEERDA